MTVSSTGGAPEAPGKGTGPSPGLGITLAGSGSRTLPSAGSETPLAPEQRCRGAWLERVQLQGPVCSPRAATDSNADTLGSSCCEESGPEASPWANPLRIPEGPSPIPALPGERTGCVCTREGTRHGETFRLLWPVPASAAPKPAPGACSGSRAAVGQLRLPLQRAGWPWAGRPGNERKLRSADAECCGSAGPRPEEAGEALSCAAGRSP